MARMNRGMARQAIDLLDVYPSDGVTGDSIRARCGIQLLAVRASSGHVVGVDDTAEMVEQAPAHGPGARLIRVGSSSGKAPWKVRHSRMRRSTRRWRSTRCRSGPMSWPGRERMRCVMKPGDRVVLGFTRYSG